MKIENGCVYVFPCGYLSIQPQKQTTGKILVMKILQKTECGGLTHLVNQILSGNFKSDKEYQNKTANYFAKYYNCLLNNQGLKEALNIFDSHLSDYLTNLE